MIIFPDLSEIEVEGVKEAEEITLTLRTTSLTAPCPSCGAASSRIQSRYTRTLRDLPSVGHPIRLIMHVRRFFCQKRTCAQKIFAERLPALCRPHAQRTTRLQQALCALGLAVGGQAGADVGSELALSGSRDTILRLVHQAQSSSHQPPRIIGVDDWAWKRRQRYGTLICDLERGVPIDVLADRSVETVSAWLKAHPSIELVSRDGSTEYASAITKGAPQARQVSDRWHVAKNLSQCLSTLLAHTLAELRQAEQEKAAGREGEKTRPPMRHTGETVAIQQTQRLRQAERTQRYEQILALRKLGMGTPEIAAQMNMPARTIRHWLARGSAPDFRHRWSRAQAHLGASHLAYLRQRWSQGCHKVSQLDRELRSLGYQGSRRSLYRVVAAFDLAAGSAEADRSQVSEQMETPTYLSALTLSVQQATWLFFRKQEELNESEQQHLEQLRQVHPRLEQAYQLVSTFLRMLRERTGHQLEQWLADVRESGLSEFDSFLTGIQRDKDAVLAGLTLAWSSGPTEGQVNRLKLIKRSMYGQAQVDLLKRRVLYHSKKSQARKDKKKRAPQGASRKASTVRTDDTNFQYTTSEISKVA